MASTVTANPVFRIEFDREKDGRWIAEVPGLPGVLSYGATKQEALVRVKALAFRVLADRAERQKKAPNSVRFACA